MRMTVAICTWNRCDLLRQTLERLTELRQPPGADWELVVVNNRCTDATDDILAALADRLPLRRIYEPEPGQSNARNAAIRAARGEYIIWTDDDVLVDPKWLEAYAIAFDRHPSAAFFGGPIRPWFDGTPPDWLRRGFSGVEAAFAALDLGDQPLQLTARSFPYGANMVVRREAYDHVMYDPNLGVRPGSSMRSEEMALVHYLLHIGAEGRWVPEAVVTHFIPKQRQTEAYLRDYYWGWGEYLGRGADRAQARLALAGRPLWLWREALEAETRYRVRRLVSRPEVWLEDLKTASTAWGRFRWYGAGYAR